MTPLQQATEKQLYQMIVMVDDGRNDKVYGEEWEHLAAFLDGTKPDFCGRATLEGVIKWLEWDTRAQ